jgi:phosphohistidine phosphatase
MELYLLRHGIAEDFAASGRDADRALTSEGKKKLKEIFRAAAQADLRPSMILTSPFRRAKETAALAMKGLDYSGDLIESSALVPNAHPQELWEEVRVHRTEPKLLLVSHEPLMSSAAAFLLNASGLRIDFKKGAILRIDLEGFSAHPTGLLKWYLTPRLVT